MQRWRSGVILSVSQVEKCKLLTREAFKGLGF